MGCWGLHGDGGVGDCMVMGVLRTVDGVLGTAW